MKESIFYLIKPKFPSMYGGSNKLVALILFKHHSHILGQKFFGVETVANLIPVFWISFGIERPLSYFKKFNISMCKVWSMMGIEHKNYSGFGFDELTTCS